MIFSTSDSVPYTFKAGTPEAWTLGNVTLRMHDELCIGPGAEWLLQGNVKLVDYFDSDPDNTGGKATRGLSGEIAVRSANMLGEHIAKPMNMIWNASLEDTVRGKLHYKGLGYPVQTKDTLSFRNSGWRRSP